MRVLLLGEYSGFYTNLKKGLEKIGVDCVLGSNADGWKKIGGADFQLYATEGRNLFTKIYHNIIYPLINKERLVGYDIVQLVGPYIYCPYINKYMFNFIKKHNKKVYISVAGNCYSLYKAYKEKRLGYYIYDNNEELCRLFESDDYKSNIKKRNEEYFYQQVDGIIPIMYEYAVGVRKYENYKRTIPLAFDCSDINYCPNVVKDKIVIMHGIIREKYKGSSYIKEALDIIKKKYPDEVEVIIDGKLPLEEYLDVLSRTNILIDQCKEHCYGLNALYAMAQGKIVLGGASYNSLKEFGLEKSPVIHIKPDVQQIVNQLEELISKKDEFEKLGYESRKFVEEFHDSKKIAQMYLDVWAE